MMLTFYHYKKIIKGQTQSTPVIPALGEVDKGGLGRSQRIVMSLIQPG